MKFGFVILATALLLSITAEYYSIMGLVAIFAAAEIPVIVMGASMGLGKIVATVWTHNNWKRVPWTFKTYLVPAIVFLMMLTSMGIFGFLSKAHLEQATNTGNAQAQVALFDDKIKTEKDNIDTARLALKQMDAAVDQTISRSTDTGSVQIASALRKRQAGERAAIQKEIAAAQKNIAKLQEERAPLALESRKIEAEVGPIKYIAALIYGDNPDANLLERAVRWVIILIVAVFDPLALCLILAANLQFEWARHGKGGYVHDEDEDNGTPSTVPASEAIVQEVPVTRLESTEFIPHKDEPVVTEVVVPKVELVDGESEDDIVEVAEMASEWDIEEAPVLESVVSAVVEPEVISVVEDPMDIEEETVVAPVITPEERVARLTAAFESKMARYEEEEDFDPELIALADAALARIAAAEEEDSVSAEEVVEDVVEPVEEPVAEESAVVEEVIDEQHVEVIQPAAIPEINDLMNITDATPPPKMVEVVTEYVDPNTRIKSFVHNWVPDTDVSFGAVADNAPAEISSDFGATFPAKPKKGDMYVRVDFLPSKLFKYNGNNKWMEVDKSLTDSYAFNEEYVKYLIERLNSGEYSVEDLTETEQDQISEYLNKNA